MSLDGTTAQAGGTSTEGNAPEGVAATAPVTQPDELATLKNRNSGLNAKVTELQKQLADEQKARTTAEAAVTSNDKADESLRKQIVDLQEQIAAGKREAALATAGAKYPEAFGLLGEGIAGMPAENLAALEARLTAAKDPGETELPTPLGNSPKRTTGEKNIEDMTSAELQAYAKTLDRSVMGLRS